MKLLFVASSQNLPFFWLKIYHFLAQNLPFFAQNIPFFGSKFTMFSNLPDLAKAKMGKNPA